MDSRQRPLTRALTVLVTLGVLLSALAVIPWTDNATATIVVVNGDWTVSGTDNVYDGVVFKVDGNVTILSGALLEIRNGGLTFLEDSNHIYWLDIQDGASGHGQLVLDNSVLTTEPNQLSDYLKLDVTVAGDLILRNGATIKHPGTLTVTGDGALEVHDSVITGFTPEELTGFTGLTVKDNDDAPVMRFEGTASGLVTASTVSRLYENSDDPGPDSRYNITLDNSATLTVIDSFVGIDFHPDGALHNTISAGGTSRVYLYGLTLDQAQSDQVSPSEWVPALGLEGPRQTLTLRAFPTLQGEKDTTGEPLADAQADDGTDYTVEPGERLYFEEFDADGRWNLLNATLVVEYWTDAGYNGTEAVQYGLEGEALTDVILIQDTGGVGGLTLTQATLSEVETFADARFLDVSFLNGDTENRNVNFDFVAVDVRYERIDSDAEIYVHRWLDAGVRDRFGSAVSDADVESRLLPSGVLATYPENGDATTPPAEVLSYLGRTSTTFNQTDAQGAARIPLLTGWVNSSVFDPTMPNAHFIGNYRIRASFSGEEAVSDLAFDAYPVMTEASAALALVQELADLVWPAQDTTYLWDEPLVIDYDLEMDGNVRVTSDVRIVDAELRILQGDALSGRHYLMIESSGSLTFEGGALTSNLPLVVYLADSGRLTTLGTDLLLNDGGTRGIIFSEHSSQVDLRDGRLEGDLEARGGDAGVRNMILADTSLTFDNAGTSSLWSPTFESNVALALLSDDGNVDTVDFDLRNATFEDPLDDAVVFDGTQYAHLTDVTFPGDGDWWEGRILEDAKVSYHRWLAVDAVDGVGDPVTDVNFTLQQLNPDTLTFEAIPAPSDGDLFGGTYAAGVVNSPGGSILYRALAQERLADQGWSNSTYRVNASKVVDGTTYYAEDEATVAMKTNVDVEMVLFNWPDLRISGSDVTVLQSPVEGANVPVEVTVHNDGTANALGARVEIYSGGSLADSEEVDVPLGESATVTLNWVPTQTGTQNLTVVVQTRDDVPENTDQDLSDNQVDVPVEVLTKPDLELRPSEYDTVTTVKGRSFTVRAVVYNTGSTDAENFDVGLYRDSVAPENLLALRIGLTVPGGENLTLLLESNPIEVEGNYTLIILADVGNSVPETSEDNNRVDVPLQVVPPEGSVFLSQPAEGASFNMGEQVFVSGSVTTPTGQPIPDMRITLALADPNGAVLDSKAVFTNQNGEFVVGLQIPAEGVAGTWTVTAAAEAGTISSASARVSVAEVVPWHLQTVPVVGLPVWMLLAVLILFVLVVVGMGAYMRAFGLGRLVECGECGAFIKESASSCPKCGTEFETEMAKCSSCHAWIPAEVKRCPECGVEFTTGKSKGTDYKERMRKQYDKVVNRYRNEAARALGHRPSEKEFQEWWRRQPTYVTFEKWLKEEEEMRKMGSKPCPRCKTLNSITATICHRCGTLLSGDAPSGRGPPPGGGGPSPGPPKPPAGGGGAKGGDEKKAVLKKIVKKPFTKKEKKE